MKRTLFLNILLSASFLIDSLGSQEWIKGESTSIHCCKVDTIAEIMARDSIIKTHHPVQKPAYRHTGKQKEDLSVDAGPQFYDLNQGIQLSLKQEACCEIFPEAAVLGSVNTGELAPADPNFTAAAYADSGFVPPDSMGAVGPQQYIAIVNGRIRSFSKQTGAADGILDATTDAFFASVLQPNASTSDPRIRYDRWSGRWYIVMVGFVPFGTGDNHVLIAVSTGSVLCSAMPWNFFSFSPASIQPSSGIVNYFADFPTLGIDISALYIGINVFGNSGGYVTSEGFVVNKQSLVQGGPIVVTAFRYLVDPNTFVGPFSPQGVDVYDPRATEGYFIGVDGSSSGLLQLIKIGNAGGQPVVRSPNIPIPVLATADPLPVPHLGNLSGPSGYLDAIDTRLGNAHLRNGFLYTVHNIGVNNQGVSSGTITRDGCRWYEINIRYVSYPALRQAGTLYTASATNDFTKRYYWIPSIMTNGLLTMVVGCSSAGANEFINAAYAYRLSSDPLGTIRSGILFTNSLTAYNLNVGGSPRRWGDFSNTCIDPSDNLTIWTTQEYCNATDSWGVQVVNITSPPPPAVLSVSQPQVNKGRQGIALKILADKLLPHAFYDPGEEFEKRLKIDLSNGVSVESIDYVGPSEIQLTISTMDAVEGAVDVLITNPDGQFTIGKELLEVKTGV